MLDEATKSRMLVQAARVRLEREVLNLRSQVASLQHVANVHVEQRDAARAELERLREALQSTLEIFDNTCRPGMARAIGWRATAIAMGSALRAALPEHETPAHRPGEDGTPAP